MHHISETISSPFRGAFHRSLAVLSAIDLHSCLALDGGPPRFRPGFSCPTVLRKSHPQCPLSATGLSPSLAARSRVVCLEGTDRFLGSYNPLQVNRRVWANPLSLATTQGVSPPFALAGSGGVELISFPQLHEMFQFTE